MPRIAAGGGVAVEEQATAQMAITTLTMARQCRQGSTMSLASSRLAFPGLSAPILSINFRPLMNGNKFFLKEPNSELDRTTWPNCQPVLFFSLAFRPKKSKQIWGSFNFGPHPPQPPVSSITVICMNIPNPMGTTNLDHTEKSYPIIEYCANSISEC
ncbi:unnamed protein product [Nesidiocoris tenuis]|uniref:Uncharacterized protein n=1 Tax=Nesidiocoris tenuis TaxID=355587 RepID=A0A6H5H1Y7_9HEMI|nr:unnamed protein product [Nesidiocoris tenuis]